MQTNIESEVGTDDYDSEPGVPWFLGINSWESTGFQIRALAKLRTYTRNHRQPKSVPGRHGRLRASA